MQDTVWITAKGERILVSNMDTSHINACIAKIRRSRKGWRKEYLPRLELELDIRSLNLRQGR